MRLHSFGTNYLHVEGGGWVGGGGGGGGGGIHVFVALLTLFS